MNAWLKALAKVESNPVDADKIYPLIISDLKKELSEQNLEYDPRKSTDKTDKIHLSGLSGENWNPQEQNLEYDSRKLTDKPDTEIQATIDDFAERAAIVEYDGGRTAVEAERTAYQEVFINVFSQYYPDEAAKILKSDWFRQTIYQVQTWLNAIGLPQPH